MGFVRRVISGALDLANLANHNANFADIETDLTEHRGRFVEVETSLADQDVRITNLIVNAGDSGPEARDARVSSATGTAYPTLKDRLDIEMTSLMAFLNYMPINGGSFDGNDPTGPIIDGGTY
ncbi:MULTISPECIES: hypothetical protein [Paenibacillus]|uniref:hypothetical protein n=1 Tax=Paenibacillus TaxID=44249 RepID=UPI00096EEA72|nr:hypothetical protein [Paenibacillus odorifer]OME21593.1 hypothetical protein BSK57_19805 [Paenibacillus odorifer]